MFSKKKKRPEGRFLNSFLPGAYERVQAGLGSRPAEALSAAAVLVGTGIDFNLVANAAEQRHLQFKTRSELGGFQDLARRRVTLDSRFRINDLANQRGRQFNRDGFLVVEHHFAWH